MTKKRMFFTKKKSIIPTDKLSYYCGFSGNVSTRFSNWINGDDNVSAGGFILTPSLVGTGITTTNTPSSFTMPSTYPYSLIDEINGEVPVSICFIANGQINNPNGVWFINKRDPTTINEYQITSPPNSNKLAVAFWDSSGDRIYVETGDNLLDNQYNIVTVTYDGLKVADGSGIKIYFDGVLQSTTDGGTGSYTGMVNTSTNLGLNHRVWVTGFAWTTGLIDEVGIFKNCELTQAEVTAINDKFNAGENLIQQP